MESMNVQIPDYRYVDKVLRSNSYEELHWRFTEAHKPSKEISESYAAFHWMKKYCRVEDFIWLHIGDGAYTRTAAIFAFFSKSFNLSIDPMINVKKFFDWQDRFNVKNVAINQHKFEELTEEQLLIFMKNSKIYRHVEGDFSNKSYNICCVHAHVNLEDLDKQYPNWNYMYTNPCCMPGKQKFSKEYCLKNDIEVLIQKKDMSILAKDREIVVYRNNRILKNKIINNKYYGTVYEHTSGTAKGTRFFSSYNPSKEIGTRDSDGHLVVGHGKTLEECMSMCELTNKTYFKDINDLYNTIRTWTIH